MKTKTLAKIILSIIFILVIIVFDFVLLSRINKQYDYIAETKRRIAVESSQATSLTDTKNKIEELKLINNRISSVLISESDAVSFITLIEDLATQAGVEIKINKVDFQQPESEDKFGILDLQFKINGDWTKVTNFLNSLESLPYIIRINSIRFSIIPESSGLWSVDFGLIGLTD